MEKIYKSLYSKYAPNLTDEEINSGVAYLLTQSPSQAVDSFYQKYVGNLPTVEQKGYIFSRMADSIPEPNQPQEKLDAGYWKRFTNSMKRIFSSVVDDVPRDNAARQIQRANANLDRIYNNPDLTEFKVGNSFMPIASPTTNISSSVPSYKSLPRDEAIQYYKDIIAKNEQIYMENYIESAEVQNYLNQYKKIHIFEDDGDSELWDDFHLTFDKAAGVAVEQLPQMLGAFISFGYTTYAQEGGAVASELIDKLAAQNLDVSYEEFLTLDETTRAREVLNIIQDGDAVEALQEAHRVGLQNAAFDYASNLFLVGKATKFVPKSAFRGFLRGKINKDAANYLKGLGYSQLAEVVTENAQEINSALATDNPITANLIAETTAQTILGAGTTQVAIGTTKFTISEGIAELTALNDPTSLRAIANELKRQIKNSNRTNDEKNSMLREIDIAENIVNNSKNKYLSYEAKKKMFQFEIEKVNAQEKLTGLENEFKTNKSISIEAQIQNEKNRIENYNNQIARTIYYEYFNTSGENLLSYINADKTGFFANKKGIMRATRAELKAWLEKNRPDLLNDPEVINMLEGTVNEAGMRIYNPGVAVGDLALFVKENVENNIFKNKGVFSTSANVVHHEVMHFIFDSLSNKDKAQVVKELNTAFANSKDTKMINAYNQLLKRLSVYGKFDLNNMTIVNEYLSGLSDVLSQQTALENIQQGDMFNQMGDAFAKAFSKTLKDIPFEIDGENALELILRYNSFAGIKPASVRPTIEAVADVVQTAVTTGKTDIDEETKPSIEVELSSEEIQNSQNALDKYITEDIKTQDDFKNSDTARAGIYTEIEVNLVIDPVINSIIQRDENTSGLAPEIQEDIKRKVRERITERVFKNFNPVLDGNKRSVFSYIYGKKETKGTGGIAFRAFQDVKLEYVKKPQGQSIETDAGVTIDIVDETATDIESAIDSKILSENIENTSNPKIEDEIDILTEDDIKDLEEFVNEIFGEDQAFDPSDPDFRKNIKTLFESAVMPKIRKAAGNFKTFYDNYIEKLFDPDKKLLSIQYLYQAERSLEDKNFAKFNKTLTTQKEIRKARDEKRAFVENEAQGVSLYDRLEFNKEATDSYYEPNNTKPNSTIRARRNKLFAEIGKELLFNLAPSAIKKSPLSTEEQATAARKIERGLASKEFAFEMGLAGIYYNVGNDVTRYSNGMIEFLPYLDKYPGLLNIGITTSGLEMGGYISKEQIQEIKQNLLKASDNWVGKKNFSYGKSATRKQALTDTEKNYYKGAPFTRSMLQKNTNSQNKERSKRYVNAGMHLWLAINEFINEPNITKEQRNERILTMIHFMVNSFKDKSHLHRRMARLAGYDVVAVANNEPMIMEHAMQSSTAWKELIRGSVKKEIPFIQLLDKVVQNYALVGLSKKDADKVDTAFYIDNNGKRKSYKFGMGRNWNIFNNRWIERFANQDVANNGGINLKRIKTLEGVTFEKQYDINKDGSPLTKPSREVDINIERKGISVFDFDDTLAFSDSKVIVNLPDGTTREITPAQFASESESLQEQGATFNFEQFNKVIKGRKGPLADLALKRQNKFGSGDIFVLTARPQESAGAIKLFLDSIGLNIPLENITGLSNGSPEAKSLWMLGKAQEGYNDFYFADDALPNVQAVKNVLDQVDVKSRVEQAKAAKDIDLSAEFNSIIEQKTGVLATDTYSAVRARRRGKRKGMFNFFIPPSAEDFQGLMYTLLPKSKEGEQAIEWFRKNLFKPFGVAMQNIEKERAAIMADFQELKKRLPKLPKKAGILSRSPLDKKILDGDFTMQDAVRVYIWDKQGMKIPNLDKSEKDALVNIIKKDKIFKDFADNLILINKSDGYVKPDNNWESGNISTDLKQNINTSKRAKHLQEWQKNVDEIFTEENLNKLEGLFGRGFRSALEDILRRMKTGVNRNPGGNKIVNDMLDWLNNAVGTIMFLNRKSALLQTISSVNFINWSDNNLLKAGQAWANQPQFWRDFIRLFNSDYLMQRRGGLKLNINESELVEQAERGGVRGVISLLLNKGFVLTRYADSFAIAIGGSTFFRNRTQTYLNRGQTLEEAEANAFQDFREISEETQQSSRPDRISQQQASALGRVILAFANTPMQYARLMKRAAQDIINKRGDWKTNWSKLIYYSFVQNFLFNAMQQALFAMGFDDEDDEKSQERLAKTAEGMFDSILRGTGIYGNIVMMGKNVAVDVARRANKPVPKFGEAAWKLFDVAPPLDRKVTQIRQALYVFDYEMDEVKDAGISLDNPAAMSAARLISATANIPVDQAMRLYEQVKAVSDDETETWQKVALILGWDGWTLNIEEDRDILGDDKGGKLKTKKLKPLKLKKIKLK